MRAFLKHLPKNISAILTICEDVSILRFRYMLRSNPEHSGGRDPTILGMVNRSLARLLNFNVFFLKQIIPDVY